MPKKRYALTSLAESDLREARLWSLSRWGKKLTGGCFTDLHKADYMIRREVAKIRNHLKRGKLTLPE